MAGLSLKQSKVGKVAGLHVDGPQLPPIFPGQFASGQVQHNGLNPEGQGRPEPPTNTL
jgi:hypothetical protein